MLIKVLITILGIFFLLAFESFFMTLFSFSILIVITFVLIDRIDWRKWVVIITIMSLLIDILIHRSLGVTLLSVSISTAILYLLFILIPRKKLILSYIPYLISTFIFYIFSTVIGSLVQSGVFGVLTWQMLLSFLVKAIISAVLIFGINTVMDNFRSNKDLLI